MPGNFGLSFDFDSKLVLERSTVLGWTTRPGGSSLDGSGNPNLSRRGHSVGLRGGDRAGRGIGAARIISEEPSLSQPSGGFFALR